MQWREPGPRTCEEHRLFVAGGSERQILEQDVGRQADKRERAENGNGAYLLDVPAEGEAAEHYQRYHHEVNQYIGKHYNYYIK